MMDHRTQLCECMNECEAKTVVTIDVTYPVIKNVVRNGQAENVVIISIADLLPVYNRILYQAKSK